MNNQHQSPQQHVVKKQKTAEEKNQAREINRAQLMAGNLPVIGVDEVQNNQSEIIIDTMGP